MPLLLIPPLVLLAGYGVGRWKGDQKTPLPVQSTGVSGTQLFGAAALILAGVFAFKQIKKAF